MRPKSIASLQILRAYAALAVVFYHVVHEISVQSPDSVGHYLEEMSLRGPSGVDLFFVISGFIMLYNHKSDSSGWNSSKEFLIKRVKRIYPVYWV